MPRLYISGNAVDQNQVPVVGALVYVRAGGVLATLEDAAGGTLANPVRTIADGFWEAYSVSAGSLTLEYYWGGKLRYIEAVSDVDRILAAAAAAQAAAGVGGYPNTAAGLAGTELTDTFYTTTAGVGTIYRHDPGPVATEIGRFIVDPTASGAAALIGHGESTVADELPVSVKFYGAVGDGVTDDTAAIQAAVDSLTNGGVVTVPTGVYKIDTNLTIPNGVTLDGGIRNPDPARAGNPPALARTPRFALASTATITLRNGSAIQGLYIQRQGLVAGENPATWAGTAITVKGAGTYQGDLLVAGFNRWCDATSALDDERCARLRAERVLFDCRNGIVIEQCFDIPYVVECHGNDLTAASTTLRDGVGFQYSNSVDWGRFTNCFTYGFAVGFRIDDAADCVLTNCGADYDPTGTATAIGFDISGTARTTKLIGCQSAATGTAVRVDVGTSTYPHAQLIGCSFWDIDTAGVSLLSGNVTVIGSTFSGGTQVAIVTANTTSAVSVTATGNTYNGLAQVYNIQNAATLNKSVIHGNVLIGSTDSAVGDHHGFDSGQRDLITFRSANATNVGVRFSFDKARGTLAAPTLPSANDTSLNVIGRGWTGSAWGQNAQIRAQFEGTPSASNTAGQIIFSTTATGATTVTDRVIINQAGRVSILNWPVFADNAAAVSGGLPVNTLYRTAAGDVKAVV